MQPQTVIAFATLLWVTPLLAEVPPQQIAPPNAPAHVVVAGETEPGERLIVTGRVTDGEAPVQGVSIFVYHTDAKGLYSFNANNDATDPRLHGAMRSDAAGAYTFDTIRPGPYPNSTFAAHVHYIVTAPGYRDQRFETLFADDPFVTDEIRAYAARSGSGKYILPVMRDAQGIWHCTHDIVLERN